MNIYTTMKQNLFAACAALCLGGAFLSAAEEIKPVETIPFPESFDISYLVGGYERATQLCVTPDGLHVLGAGYGIKPFCVDVEGKKMTIIPTERPDDARILYLDDHYFLLNAPQGYRWLDFDGNKPDDARLHRTYPIASGEDGGYIVDRIVPAFDELDREMRKLGLPPEGMPIGISYVWLKPNTDGFIAFSVACSPIPVALITPGFQSSYLFPTDRVFSTDFCWERASRRFALLYQKLPLKAAPMTGPFFQRLPQLTSGYAVFDYKGKLIDEVPLHADRAKNPVRLNFDGEDHIHPLSMFYACLHRDYLYFIDQGGLFVRDIEGKQTRLLCAGIGEAELPNFRFGFMQRFKVMPNGVVAFVAWTSIPGRDPSNGRDTHVVLLKDGQVLASTSLHPIGDYRLDIEMPDAPLVSHLYQTADNYLIAGLYASDDRFRYYFIDTDHPERIEDSSYVDVKALTRFHSSLIRGKLYGITAQVGKEPAYIGIYALKPDGKPEEGDDDESEEE